MLMQVRLAGSSLAQAGESISVVVVDPRGTPFVGAQVTLQGFAMPGVTNGSGIATFTGVPAGDVVASVKVAGFSLRARGSTDQTLFVTVPVCAPGPIVSSAELVALVLGVGATAGGLIYKKRAAEMLGEILIGSSIFSAVYRASCRW